MVKDVVGEDIFINTIVDELTNLRPVHFGGGQHAFIIDGYNELGGGEYSFSINWGWSGLYQEDYWTLNNLIPNGHNFNDNQTLIKVQPAQLSVYFEPSISYIHQDEDVQFNTDYLYLGSGTISWSWDFGDGSTSNEQNPSHIFANQGSHTCTLTVSDGTYSDTFSKTIFVKDNIDVWHLIPVTSGQISNYDYGDTIIFEEGDYTPYLPLIEINNNKVKLATKYIEDGDISHISNHCCPIKIVTG